MKILFLTLLVLACAKLSMGRLQLVVANNSSVKLSLQLSYPFDESETNRKDRSGTSIPNVKRDLTTNLQQLISPNISASTKNLARTELSYHYANKLLKICRNLMRKISRQTPRKIPNARLLIRTPEGQVHLHITGIRGIKQVNVYFYTSN